MDDKREIRLDRKWKSLKRSNARKSLVQYGKSLDDPGDWGTVVDNVDSTNVNVDGSHREDAMVTPVGKFRDSNTAIVIHGVKTNQLSPKDISKPTNDPLCMRRMSSIAGITLETEPKETLDEKPKSPRRASLSQLPSS